MDTKNRILSKFTSGRTKAIKKRKKTLLLEYKLKNKNNKFMDRRIGEKNRGMSEEDRTMARFVAQQMKAYNKKQLFNLGDGDEILTHHGRNIQDIEKFDNPQSESEDDENGNEKLNAEFVKKAHFGGGLFTKVSPMENDHRSIVDQLIAESKIRKAERQQTKEETQNLTEKLDEDLKELFPIFSQSGKENENLLNSKLANESYDILVRELKFAPVGKPTNKIKPDNQIAIEEKRRLEKLEKERLERMKLSYEFEDKNENETSNEKLRSADDLEDGFVLDNFDDMNEESDEGSLTEDNNDNDSETEEHNTINKTNANAIINLDENVTNVKTMEKFIVPTDLYSLEQIFFQKNIDEKIDAVKNIIKQQCVHSGVSNKETLLNFFNVLLEYIDSIFISSEDKDCWIITSKLSPILYELTQVCKDSAAESMFQIIKKKQETFCENTKQEVTADTLIFLKLVPLLFPTSDYYHPVATPSAAFLCHILSENSCGTLKCISKGLFLVTLILEYVNLSNRYCPEVITFFKRVLYIATLNREDSFAPVHSKNELLILDDNEESTILTENIQLSYSFISDDILVNNKTKISIIYINLKLLAAYYDLYNKLSAASAIWSSVLTLLDKLPIDKYPCCVQNELKKLQSEISLIKTRPLQYLVAERKRPKALRLYEPNIRPIIDGKSFRTVSQAKLEKEKLMHQYKREMKGALREIRKDKNFLARVKVSEQAKRDAERKEKVKRIFSWGQVQQSEFKRMEQRRRFGR
ncbi:hypothetical protein PGB90_009976 [Kerria lacca]